VGKWQPAAAFMLRRIADGLDGSGPANLPGPDQHEPGGISMNTDVPAALDALFAQTKIHK
jgi:hypothetical protein